jgi:hypothetical protein
MKKTFNIWIPSIQNYLRFNELSVSQYMIILKSIEDNELDLIYTLNDIIRHNIISIFDTDKLTTLDRFIIFLALKINSCSSHLVLSSSCEKCGTQSSIKMNLNTLVDNLGERIDKSFAKTLTIESFIVNCDIPTIATDYKIQEYGALRNVNKTNIDFVLNNYIASHIKSIIIGGNKIDFNLLSYDEQIIVVGAIPSIVTDYIKKYFLANIHDAVSNFDFLKIPCTKKECKEELEIKFDITNIIDVIKIIFKDSSANSVLSEMARVCEESHLGGDMVMNLSPMELHYLFNAYQQSKSDQSTNQNKDRDLFDEYSKETQELSESPSEFSNM